MENLLDLIDAPTPENVDYPIDPVCSVADELANRAAGQQDEARSIHTNQNKSSAESAMHDDSSMQQFEDLKRHLMQKNEQLVSAKQHLGIAKEQRRRLEEKAAAANVREIETATLLSKERQKHDNMRAEIENEKKLLAERTEMQTLAESKM